MIGVLKSRMACIVSDLQNLLLDLNVTDEDTNVDVEDEVVDEPLNENQAAWFNRFEEDYDNLLQKLDSYTEEGEVLGKTDNLLAIRVGAESPGLGHSVLPITTAASPPLTTVTTSRPPQPTGPPIMVGPPATSALHMQAVPTGGVILQSTNTLSANVVARPSGTGAPPPPGTYQLVMDPRVGGIFVGPVPAATISQNAPTFRAPVSAALTKNSQLRTQTVAVPGTKSVLVPVTCSGASVLIQKQVNVNKVTWPGTAPTNARMQTTVSTSLGSAIASASVGSPMNVPLRPSRGRPPRHAVHNMGNRNISIAPLNSPGAAPMVDLTAGERRMRPLVSSSSNSLKTNDNLDLMASMNRTPTTTPCLNASSATTTATPTTTTTITTVAKHNSGVGSSNSVGYRHRSQSNLMSRPPPLTAIVSKTPLLAPKPVISQIRSLSISNAVGLGPIMPANQIRPPGLTNQFRPGPPPPGIRTTLVNGPRPVNNGARVVPLLNSTQVPADSREVNFNKLGVGKTFPSLVVVAKPTLRMKEFSSATVSRDRAELDQQVKELLMNSMTKLTEWLIQQGLVRSAQICQTHRTPATGEPVNLKLGMYSDVSKFPHSGGYVWICEFCPTQLFVSVFSGSIFEGAPHPPLVLLKLIYHWACQTTSSNIVAWVKVESFYVKMFFTHMRAICTAAVHENYELMGGPNRRVEVGVISLGTAAQDGSTRNVKVEVLGVMDVESKLIRLRAVEPLQEGEKNYKRRFVKILEPLAKWVHKKSTILTDFTVDKGTLHNMGFATVHQVSVHPETSQEKAPKNSNINVMNYLRRVVPRMFQNTLSLLSRQIIQQFLDELVWRERWGPVSSQAYNNIIKHIAEQTRANTGTSLLRRLGKISDDPFRDWRYSTEEDVHILGDKKPIIPAPPPLVPVIPVPATSAGPAALAASAVSAAPAGMPAPSVPTASAVPVVAPVPDLAVIPSASSSATASSTPELIRPSIDMLPFGISQSDSDVIPVERSAPAAARRGRKRYGEPVFVDRPRKRTADPLVRKPYSTLVVGTEQSTSLQAYYYATLEGDPVAVSEEKKELPILKCCVCVRKFSNNIQLMKHLILHTQVSQFSSELSDVTQCKYCLKSFPTPFLMQTHLEEVHLSTGNNDICMICTERFKDTSTLIAHMHRTHVAWEMPYVCHVCQFRSSMHRDLIDHFYEVHNNGEKMQCPFCLKTVAVCANGRRLGSNISFFLTHIQKHQRRSVVKKCTRCALWFVNKWAIREHLQRDHVSFKGVAGVKPAFPDTGDDIKMPLPPAELGPSATLSAIRRGSNFPSRGCHSTTYLLPTLILDSDITENSCIECKEEINEYHFPGYSLCSRCRFATCCPNAMKDHMRTFHELTDEPPNFDIGKPVQLLSPLFCVCGYSTDSGNRIAKHLALCDRRSAYPSASKAKAATVQSASFPPLVTLDDAENNSEDPSDKWLKAFVPARREESEGSKESSEKKTKGADTHSMLNVLGLVRKPSTDESSLDKAPSDKEDSTEAPITGKPVKKGRKRLAE